MASAAAKRKRLDDALKQRKATPEIGDVYLFKLDDVPEDIAVFWCILYKHPEDPKLFLTVPADTDTLIGSLDVAIPEPALYGPLSLRLGRGLWLMESMFKPASRVGIIELLFMNRAQSIMSRIVSGEWIGSEQQQATDEDPDYEELMGMIDRFYFAMRTYRENLAFSQVKEEVPVKVTLADFMNLEKVKEALFQYLVAPFLPAESLQFEVSAIGETRGSSSGLVGKKIKQYVVGDNLGIRIDIPKYGYLIIVHYTEDGNINLVYPECSEDETPLRSGSKKDVFYNVKKPLGKHYLRTIWTAEPLSVNVPAEFSSDTERMNMFMKLIDRLSQSRTDDIQQKVCEYEVVPVEQ